MASETPPRTPQSKASEKAAAEMLDFFPTKKQREDEKLSRSLSELKDAARRLNEASNTINSTITSIEQKIVEANVGLECWLTAEPLQTTEPKQIAMGPNDDPAHSMTDTILGFTKVAGEGWRLAVREREYIALDDDPEEQRATPIQSDPSALWRASRELRIKALEKMPALIGQLRDRVNGALEAIAIAKKLAE